MISAIILAGGQGSRMKSSCVKQLLPFKGKLVLHHSVELFLFSGLVDEVIVVLAQPYRTHCPYQNISFAEPGARRQDSLAHGFAKISPQSKYILVHDAARPLVKLSDIKNLITEGKKAGAATLAVPSKSTLKERDALGHVVKTLPRAHIWEVQTPQFLERSIAERGLTRASAENIAVTDDVSLAELVGHKVKLVEGSYSNIKLTTAEDLPLLEALYET